jgi:hypothetical protein
MAARTATTRKREERDAFGAQARIERGDLGAGHIPLGLKNARRGDDGAGDDRGSRDATVAR